MFGNKKSKFDLYSLERELPFVREKEDQNIFQVVIGVITAAAIITGTIAGVLSFCKRKKEAEKVKIDQAQKELYRRLSKVKGR